MLNPIGWVNGAATTGIIILGTNNTLQNSTILHSSGNGVFLGGSSNSVRNCTMRAFVDYSGNDAAAIAVNGEVMTRITGNVIHDVGRDGILDSNATAAHIESNTIYNVGLQDHRTDLEARSTTTAPTAMALSSPTTRSRTSTPAGFGGDGVYLDAGSDG